MKLYWKFSIFESETVKRYEVWKWYNNHYIPNPSRKVMESL